MVGPISSPQCGGNCSDFRPAVETCNRNRKKNVRFRFESYLVPLDSCSWKTLTSVKKEFGPSFLGSNSIWSFLSGFPSAITAFRGPDHSIWGIWVHRPQILLSLGQNGQEESRLLNLGRLRSSRLEGVCLSRERVHSRTDKTPTRAPLRNTQRRSQRCPLREGISRFSPPTPESPPSGPTTRNQQVGACACLSAFLK